MDESIVQGNPVLVAMRQVSANIAWPSVSHMWRDNDPSKDQVVWRQAGTIPASAILCTAEQLSILGDLDVAPTKSIPWLDEHMEVETKDISLPEGAVGWFGPSPVFVLK
ncbi:hypothetical protein UFOVP75_159 [uncultured Caudovirales phage]|uniref:Uncharacterized protein n=1 Tax=uncultured Caudovirales phage TaxID=2100421 RepID=A0A6J5L2D5_9CAUD|nr:hypothetical protein UFOVP75_159 [uncultured Caudovirales phage]